MGRFRSALANLQLKLKTNRDYRLNRLSMTYVGNVMTDNHLVLRRSVSAEPVNLIITFLKNKTKVWK